MSRHDDRVSLKDMLSHAREAVELLGNASREELGHNRMMQLALTLAFHPARTPSETRVTLAVSRTNRFYVVPNVDYVGHKKTL